MTNEEFIESIRLPNEEWRDVVGYEGYYMVSSLGRVASNSKKLRTKFGYRVTKPKLLRQIKNKSGYCKITVSKNKEQKAALVHKLVAIAFIENKENKPMIDHIDRNKTNNNVTNLRWCTLSENMNNPLTVEHCRNLNLGRKHPSYYKPVVALKNGNVVKKYESIISAILDGFTNCGIVNCCRGREKTHHGYEWMYLSDYISCQNSDVKELLPKG